MSKEIRGMGALLCFRWSCAAAYPGSMGQGASLLQCRKESLMDLYLLYDTASVTLCSPPVRKRRPSRPKIMLSRSPALTWAASQQAN